MDFQMDIPRLFRSKRLLTNKATKRLDILMNAHVYLQVISHFKPLSTHGTFVLSLPKVGLHVLLHVPRELKVLAAQRTFILSFVAMSDQMTLQIFHGYAANIADFD